MEALKSFCRIQDTDTAAEVRERVARSLPPGAGDPDGLLPPLRDLLGLLPPEDAFRVVDPALRRQRTHDARRQVFLAASVAQPLCLIVVDLHWIDVRSWGAEITARPGGNVTGLSALAPELVGKRLEHD